MGKPILVPTAEFPHIDFLIAGIDNLVFSDVDYNVGDRVSLPIGLKEQVTRFKLLVSSQPFASVPHGSSEMILMSS